MYRICIVGRPNVGKSALFNRIVKKRLSIVDSTPGVTRDYISAPTQFRHVPFELVDTGGLGNGHTPYAEHIQEQSHKAIRNADAFIFVVDGQEGFNPLDHDIADLVRRQNKPYVVAINKADPGTDPDMIKADFYRLRLEPFVCVSASHGRGIPELLSKIVPTSVPHEEASLLRPTRLAIVGRCNAGKSTLLNKLLGFDRSMVSDVPGTTRDSVDAPMRFNGRDYLLIDTAGIRKKKAEKDVIDKFAAIRSQESIERADICLLVIDAREGLTSFDKSILKMVEEAGCALIILINKWDLCPRFRMEHSILSIEKEAPFTKHCPKICISALTGRKIDEILPLVQAVEAEYERTLPTGQLNAFIEKTIQTMPPPAISGKRLRIYYLCQQRQRPPTFLLFVNKKELIRHDYIRFLQHEMRKNFGFIGCPLRFFLTDKAQNKEMIMNI